MTWMDRQDKQVNRSLQEMELLKAELLATVSHELRSPLASIKGYAATLLRHERRISREERHQFLLAIIEAVIDLKSLFNDCMKFHSYRPAKEKLIALLLTWYTF